MPRPEANIDREELEKLCAMQCTDQEIAAFLGVSTRTIERRRKVQSFREAMECGKAKGRISVRRNLFHLARKGNLGANIFLAKNLLGYKDVVAIRSFRGSSASTLESRARRRSGRDRDIDGRGRKGFESKSPEDSRHREDSNGP